MLRESSTDGGHANWIEDDLGSFYEMTLSSSASNLGGTSPWSRMTKAVLEELSGFRILHCSITRKYN